MTDITTPTLDLRQQRTREALYQALVALLEEKPYDDISIADLTRRAKVARPTFYLHFKDIHELLLTRLEEDLQAQRDLIRDYPAGEGFVPEHSIELIAFAFERVAANAQLYRLILNGRAGPVVFNLFQQQMGALHQHVLDANCVKVEDSVLTMINGYFSGAIGGIMTAWLEQGMPKTPTEMAEMVLSLMDGKFLELLDWGHD